MSILDTDVAEIAEGLSNLKPGERYSFGCSAIDKEHPEPRVPREGRYDFSGFRVELSRDARSMASIDPSWFFNMGRYDGSTLSADSNFVTLSLSKAGLAVFTKALVLSSVVETYVGNLQVSARIGHTGPLLGTSSEGIVIVWPRRSHGLAGR